MRKIEIEKIHPYLTDEGYKLIGKNIRVVTHDGNFHTDECVAICLIQQIAGHVQIERSRDPKDHLYRHFVLDVGREYNPERGLFDHHQDATLPATNVLIAKHLFQGELLEELLIFMEEISNIDRGITTIDNRTGLNAIVNSLKGMDDAFEVALELLSTVVVGQITTCLQRMEAEVRWNEMKSLPGIKYSEEEIEPIPQWKELAEKEKVYFQVCKTFDGAMVTSRDTVHFPIGEHPKQSFLHGAKFFAKYEDFDSALNHARFMMRA